MKETEYVKHQVLQERPYILLEWCERAVQEPEATVVEPDGRVRYWRFIDEPGKHLRVITLSDGEPLHNAFPDPSFKPEAP